MIDTTILMTEESSKKEPVISLEAINGILNQSRDGNDRLTKGIAVYEMIMMAGSQDVEDQISQLEESVNEELDGYIEGVSSEVDKIKYFESPSERIRDYEKYEDAEDMTECKQSKIYLPMSFCEDLPSYGLNNVIEDCVYDYYSNPFHDRTDRIACKKELIDYLENETEPSHRVASAVVSGDSDEFDVSEANSKITDDETEEDVLEFDNPYDYAENSDEVKQTPTERVPYAQAYIDTIDEEFGVDHAMYPENEEELVDALISLFNCSEATARDTYAPQIEIHEEEIEEHERNEFFESEDYDRLMERLEDRGRLQMYPNARKDHRKFMKNIDKIPQVESDVEKKTSTNNFYAVWVGDI